MSGDDTQFSDSDLSSLLSDVESSTPTPAVPLIVETLVAGRSRRENAGNLLAKLLTQEADEEDTLFLEDEDDVEFEVKEKDLVNDDDGLMESSSDDEYDAGPPVPGGEEDLDGERELERQEKGLKRQRKRKADEAYMKPRARGKISSVKRRVMIAEEATATEGTEGEDMDVDVDVDGYNALTRPRKKSERISWVPEFIATRASSRTLSLQNRSETMRRLEESQKRRLHTIALMEKAAAKKEKVRPKRDMTQQERLVEAKLTERRNLRSLCSWEETEKQKLEEQRQRLAALQNRKLAGPVITYWSGTAEWNGETGRLVRVGKGKLVDEVEGGDALVEGGKKKKRIKKGRGKEKEEGNRNEKQKDEMNDTPQTTDPPLPPTLPNPHSLKEVNPLAPAPSTSTPVVKTDFPSFLEGILDYVALPPDHQSPPPSPLAPLVALPLPAPLPPLPAPPKSNEISGRNLVVLENFDLSAIKDRASLIKTLWGEQTRRLPTTKPYCVISHQPAKFRDPTTGMPFASLHAYREIRRLLHGEIRWSYLVGAYVGEVGVAARGVPEGF
ncbi:YL1 nuclear protein-domain-containing protein [Trichophaea hybrida]|nr:YL1 nuclear protein-domain-containing protein [Trichophaea hybrida]